MIMAMPMLVLIKGFNMEGVGMGKTRYRMNMMNKTTSKGEMEFNDGNFIILCVQKK